jgi:hypothetical protein
VVLRAARACDLRKCASGDLRGGVTPRIRRMGYDLLIRRDVRVIQRASPRAAGLWPHELERARLGGLLGAGVSS